MTCIHSFSLGVFVCMCLEVRERPTLSHVRRNSINFNKSCYHAACTSYYAIRIPEDRPVTHT